MRKNKTESFRGAFAGGPEGRRKAPDSLPRPVVVVMGGPSARERLELLETLLDQADAIVVGGGLATAFLKARGGKVGRAVLEDGTVPSAARLLERAEAAGVKVFLPVDTLAANEISPQARPSLEGSMALFDDKIAMDIGPRTVELFSNVIRRAGTVVWSGPMGILELPAFAEGTRGIARALAQSNGITIAAGEDTARAVEESGLSGQITCVSHDSGMVSRYFALESQPEYAGMGCGA